MKFWQSSLGHIDLSLISFSLTVLSFITHWLQCLFTSALCICFILRGRTRPRPCILAASKTIYTLIKWVALHHALTFFKALKMISNFNEILTALSLLIDCNKCQWWEALKAPCLLFAHENWTWCISKAVQIAKVVLERYYLVFCLYDPAIKDNLVIHFFPISFHTFHKDFKSMLTFPLMHPKGLALISSFRTSLQ